MHVGNTAQLTDEEHALVAHHTWSLFLLQAWRVSPFPHASLLARLHFLRCRR